MTMPTEKNLRLRKVVANVPRLDSVDPYEKEIHFNFASLPAAKNWEIGKKYKIVLHVEQLSKDKTGASFAVKKVGDYSGSDKKDNQYGY